MRFFRHTWNLIAGLLLPAILLIIPVHTLHAEDIALGSVAMDIPAAMVKRLSPLADYLSKETGMNVTFRASADLGSAVDDLGSETTQIAYLTPAAYLEAHEKYGAIPLVNPLSKGKGTFTLKIAVRNDSPIRKLNDLKGRTFAFGDRKAILQPAVVTSAGFRLEDFKSYDYLNHYDNIAKAVLHGDFDAGILKDSVADKYSEEGLRIIHTSPALPSYVFAINRHLNPKAASKLKKALIMLKDDNDAHRAILTALESTYTGFEAAHDKDFNGIRKLLSHSQH